jgi:hypothetical protein
MSAYNHLLGYYCKPVELREPCDLDPVVYHMINQPGFDVYSFRRMKSDASVEYFSTHHRATLNYLGSGGELKKPVNPELRIENPTGVTHGNSEDIARKTLDDLKRMLKET